MKYIRVSRSTLKLSVADALPKTGFVVPLSKRLDEGASRVLHDAIYFGVIYPLAREGESDEQRKRKYKLPGPEPWHLAVAAIVWEGLLQGLAWESVKAFARTGLAKLQSIGLAPAASAHLPVGQQTTTKKRSAFTVGVSWTKYATDGEEQERFFLGVRHQFESEHVAKRIAATRPEQFKALQRARPEDREHLEKQFTKRKRRRAKRKRH